MTTGASYHAPAPDRLLAPLGRLLDRVLGSVLPPAAISLLSLAAAAGALGAFLRDLRVAAGVLIALAAMLDAAAEMGSRRRPVGFGAVVDGLADRYADLCVLAGMAVWSHRHEGSSAPLAIGFAALIGTLALSYTAARVQASVGRAVADSLFAWTGRDARMLLAAAGALVGQVDAALALLALLTHLPVLWALLRLRGRLTAGSEP